MKFGRFCTGVALTVVGLIMLLKNITISGISFYSYHGLNTGAIIIICLIASFIFLIAKTNMLSIILFGVSILAFLISIIMGTRISLNRMDMLGFILICGLLFGGVGLVLNSLMSKGKQ